MLGALLLLAFATFEESYRAGLLALSQNRLEEARASLETAAGIEPGRSRVWVALARTYWKLGATAKADLAAGKAARLAGNDPQVFQLLAVHFSDAGQRLKSCEMTSRVDQAKGAECFSQVPDGEFEGAISGDEILRFEYANRLLQRQDFEHAVRVLEPAVKAFDKSAQLSLALGVGYYGLRRFADADRAFERTIAIDPNVEQPYIFLGKMLDQVPGRVPDLVRLCEAFERAHPESYVGYLVHGKTLKNGELLRKAAELGPQVAEPHYELGVLAEREHKFAEAAEEFEKAAALDGADAATHYHLARVYDRLEKPALAARERELHKKLMNPAPDASR